MAENAPRKPQRKENKKGSAGGDNAFMTSLEYDFEELLRVIFFWPMF